MKKLLAAALLVVSFSSVAAQTTCDEVKTKEVKSASGISVLETFDDISLIKVDGVYYHEFSANKTKEGMIEVYYKTRDNKNIAALDMTFRPDNKLSMLLLGKGDANHKTPTRIYACDLK